MGAPSPGDIKACVGATGVLAADVALSCTTLLGAAGDEVVFAATPRTATVRITTTTHKVFFMEFSFLFSKALLEVGYWLVEGDPASLRGPSLGGATGKGDGPSPTITMLLWELTGVAPEIALRPPAIIKAAT